MSCPLLYEVNTRCWLRSLSEKFGRDVKLGDVPDEELERWQSLGFTHIWPMGVWPTSPRSRTAALASAGLRRALSETLPDWKPDDVGGSPFAVAQYEVPPALGGESGLQMLRRKLHAHGLKLLLDFVPNHVGLDHKWVTARPELFVQAPAATPETFAVETPNGAMRLAHGKDPNFPAWIDTVQLDYRVAGTHAAMTDVLKSLAERCDGVRCDMAMLLLRDTFAQTWERFPCLGATTEREFWSDAIQAVKRSEPDFLFLGEVYWDLEARLQSL